MQKLHKLIVTVAGVVTVGAVALSLIPATAVAAESGSDCYAQLNAVRAKAGSPETSATDMPALAQAAAAHASYRAEASADSQADQSQHHQTPGRNGFTGATSWDRTKAAGLQDGTWSGQFETVTTTGGTLHGVQSWIDAPYHRFPLLDANNLAAGCATATASAFLGRTHSAAVLELAATWNTPTKQLTAYPAPNQTDVPVSFDRLRERPSPFADAATTVGYVASLQADGDAALKVKDMTLTKGASHTPVAVHKSVRFGTSAASGSVDANLPANAAMLAATRALDPHTTYHVRISGSVKADSNGTWTAFPTKSWSFTTA
jgi:hypothetical protein